MQYVIKSTGEKQRFNPKKIEKGILKAGGSKKCAEDVVKRVKKEYHKQIPTEKILDITLNCLKEQNEIGVLARYDLKRAIMQLGPTGYPFERFFGFILGNYNYDIKMNQIFKGKRVRHEIDIDAKEKKTRKRYMIEAKYHNSIGIHVRVKIPLYIYARFLDIKQNFDFPWLVTNTKCTPDALNYAEGVGMKVTSWSYPKDKSLQRLIEDKKLYPITVLKSVGKNTKEKLFEVNLMLVKNLLDYDIKTLKRRTGFSEAVLKKMVNEAKEVLK